MVSTMELAMLKNMPVSDPKDAPDLEALIEAQEQVDDDQPT